MSEIKAAFNIFTDKQRREELIKIIRANPVGGFMIAILSAIVPIASTVVLNMSFETIRDWAVMGFFVFIILIATTVLIYTMNKSAEKHKTILDDDRLENEKLATIAKETEIANNHIEATKEVRLSKVDVEKQMVEKEVTALNHQKEIDEFAVKTYQEQKKYQLYLLANQSGTYYEELDAIVSNMIFLSETIKGDDITTRQLKKYRERMRQLIASIGKLPELVEMTYKEFLKFKSGIDLDGDGEYESFVDEIRGIAAKVAGKSAIQTERTSPPKPIPTPVESTSDLAVALNDLEKELKNTTSPAHGSENTIFEIEEDEDFTLQ